MQKFKTDLRSLFICRSLVVSINKNKGYFNVTVNDANINQKKDENFQLVFNIDSGDKFFFNS